MPLRSSQLLSETVAKALVLSGDPAVQETAKFVSMFDKLFDALNVSNYNSGVKKMKTFQQPYRSGNDFRLKVSCNIVYSLCLCACYLTVVEG